MISAHHRDTLTRWPEVVRLESQHHLKPWSIEPSLERRLPRVQIPFVLNPAPKGGFFVVDEQPSVLDGGLSVSQDDGPVDGDHGMFWVWDIRPVVEWRDAELFRQCVQGEDCSTLSVS